jgi:hypothetical protein
MKRNVQYIKHLLALAWRTSRQGMQSLIQWIRKRSPVAHSLRRFSGTDEKPGKSSSAGGFRKGLLKTEQIRTLEVMPREVKILYTQLLALQVLADNQIDSKEFSDLYVFMAQIGLDAEARVQVRNTLESHDFSFIEFADRILEGVGVDEQPVISFSMIKDLLRVSRMDGHVSSEESDLVWQLAVHLYPEQGQAEQVLRFADKAIDYDEKLLMGQLTADEFAKGARNLAATATSIGVPITAVYFSGSVIGLSAAGIISGLTELGLGGILGLSSLVTGIGVVVVMGIVTFKLVSWAVTGNERRMEKIREHMIQEVITLNQQAMLALAEDINSLSSRMEHLAGVSEKNRQMLTQLQTLYQNALMVLRQRKERYGESEPDEDATTEEPTD